MSDKNSIELGEELYNLFAVLLNSPENRAFFDSIRGEYGVLWYLTKVDNNVSAGILKDQLHVVPGRMTDILTSLERKGLVERTRDAEDKRIVIVSITESGRKEAAKRRGEIHEKYQGLFSTLNYEDTKELIRLLKILLTYKG